jgi:hypothetical protein
MREPRSTPSPAVSATAATRATGAPPLEAPPAIPLETKLLSRPAGAGSVVTSVREDGG